MPTRTGYEWEREQLLKSLAATPLDFSIYEPRPPVSPPSSVTFAPPNMGYTMPATGITGTTGITNREGFSPTQAFLGPGFQIPLPPQVSPAGALGYLPWMRQWTQPGFQALRMAQGVAAQRDALAAYLDSVKQAAGAAAGDTAGTTDSTVGTGGKGGGGQAPSRNPAPLGLNQKWWDEFSQEHGGQNPSEFYGRQGEGLREAMSDRNWSQGFAAETGRSPTDDEWKEHYYSTRGGRPRMSRDERRMRRIAMKGGLKKKLPWFRGKKSGTADENQDMNSPLFIPPSVYWRL